MELKTKPKVFALWLALFKGRKGDGTKSPIRTPPTTSEDDPPTSPIHSSEIPDETHPRPDSLPDSPLDICSREIGPHAHITHDHPSISSADTSIEVINAQRSHTPTSSQRSQRPSEPCTIRSISDIQESTPVQTVNIQETESSLVEWEKAALLWETAYDNLKEHHADLISRYEMIVSTIWRQKEDVLDHRVSWADQANASTRRHQMASTFEIWLKHVNEKVVGDEEFVNTLPRVQSLREIMRNLVQGLPYMSLVWLAICLGLQATLHRALPLGKIHSLPIYVASRMQWYLRLPKLIPNNGKQMVDSSGTISRHYKEFETGIINLYEVILLIEILAACSSSEYVPHPPKSNNSKDTSFETLYNSLTARDVIELEQHLHICLGGIEVEGQLHQLFNFANLPKNARSSTDELMGKLHVVHKPVGSDWYFLKDFSPWKSPGNMDFTSPRTSYRVLCVTGDDTGKTIFLRSIVQQLSNPGPTSEPRTTVAYLFCDSELKARQGSCTSIVQSLIWQVLQSQPSLSKHLAHKLSVTKRDQFDGPEDFYVLSTLLCTLLQDDELNMTYFVLDGLEELCGESSYNLRDPYRDEWGLIDMVRLIYTSSRLSYKIKWLVSSTKDVRAIADGQIDIGIYHDTRDPDPSQIHIKVSVSTHDSVRQAMKKYMDLKVHELASRSNYGGNLQSQVKQILGDRSRGSLPWVNVACDIIESKGMPWNAPHILESLSHDINDLYSQTLKDLQDLIAPDKKFCNDILSTTSITFRPLSIFELEHLIGLPPEIDLKVMIERMCFAFLEIVDGKVCFKHFAARDFLRENLQKTHALHAEMVRRCLETALNNPNPEKDGSEAKSINYATIYWIRHLSETETSQASDVIESVNKFLKEHFIQWLEVLASHRLLNQTQKYLRILKATWTEKMTEDQPAGDNEDTDKPVNRAATALLRNVQGVIWFLDYHHALNTPEGLSPRNTLLFCPDIDELKDLLPFKPGTLGLSLVPVIRPDSNAFRISCQILEGHSDMIRDCAYSPDGRLVASISDDQSLRLWDSNTGRLQHILNDNDCLYMSRVVFSPECRGMLAATNFSTIRLWHIFTGTVAKTLSPSVDVGLMNCVTFSSKGDYLIAVTSRMVIRWHLPSYQESMWIDLKPVADNIIYTRLSGDEGLLAVVTKKNDIVLWDIEEAKIRHYLTAHQDTINDISFSPDSALLASCSDDRTVRVWDTKTGEQMRKLPMELDWGNSVAFSPGADRLVCGSNNKVRVWKAVIRTPGVRVYEEEHMFKGNGNMITTVRFASDGSRILSSSNRTLLIWPVNKLERDLTVQGKMKSIHTQSFKDRQDTLQGVPNRHSRPVTFITFSPDAKIVASASFEGSIVLWDADQGTPLRTLADGHIRGIWSLAFSQNGKGLVSASSDKTIGIWHVDSGKLVRRLIGHNDWVRDVKISPDGRFVASASDDSTVRVWYVADSLEGEAITEGKGNEDTKPFAQTQCTVLSVHRDYVYSVAFSPDGKYLASGGDERRILIWDLQAAAERDWDLDDNNQSKQQRQIVKAGKANTIRPCWELKDRDKLVDVRGLVFGPPDGEILVSVSSSRIVNIWKVARCSKTGERQQWQLTYCSDGYVSWPKRPFRFPEFDPKYPNVLLSENGALLVKTSASWIDASSIIPRPGGQCEVLKDEQGEMWITKNSEKVVFVPPQYQIDGKYTFHVKGTRVVIGCDSGDVLIFKF
ncbi:hypothetical protein F4859DRAFT_343899 [Xylaria cf. heliscus]|nr:hypothetical protein F4859DRAFT_343899 [Xylaria cf. heliscus]